jgi:hypothetical protein
LDEYLPTPDSGARMAKLRREYLGSASVEPGEIQGCVAGHETRSCVCVGRCEWRVLEAKGSLRDLCIVAEQALHVQVAMKTEGIVPMDSDVAANESVKFPITKEGATLQRPARCERQWQSRETRAHQAARARRVRRDP